MCERERPDVQNNSPPVCDLSVVRSELGDLIPLAVQVARGGARREVEAWKDPLQAALTALKPEIYRVDPESGSTLT